MENKKGSFNEGKTEWLITGRWGRKSVKWGTSSRTKPSSLRALTLNGRFWRQNNDFVGGFLDLREKWGLNWNNENLWEFNNSKSNEEGEAASERSIVETENLKLCGREIVCFGNGGMIRCGQLSWIFNYEPRYYFILVSKKLQTFLWLLGGFDLLTVQSRILESCTTLICILWYLVLITNRPNKKTEFFLLNFFIKKQRK
jgi:hypothetical protein